MLKKLEQKLKRKARKVGLGRKRADAYVYESLRKPTGTQKSRRGQKGNNPVAMYAPHFNRPETGEDIV